MTTTPPTSDLAPLGSTPMERPAGGNASLKTVGYTADGTLKNFETRFWIKSFSTDLELKFAIARLRRGVSNIPIRQQERYISFTAQFKAQGSNYELLSKRIRAHWQVNLNTSNNAPMVFTYFGAGRQWLGFVEEVRHSAVTNEVLYDRQFQMRVINRDASAEAATLTQGGPFVPSRGDVHTDWEGWMGQDTLAGLAMDLGFDLGTPAPAPTRTPTPGRDPANPRTPWEYDG